MEQKLDFKIYTSYFGNGKNLIAANIEPVGIAVFPPSWFNGTSIFLLAPTASMLKLPRGEYDRQFKQRLALIDSKKVVQILKEINLTKKKDIALCCFEQRPEDCHRSMVANWLSRREGIDIREWVRAEKIEPETPKQIQGSLF